MVTLGNFATKQLLRTAKGITRLRGQPVAWWLGAVLIPTFHPAAALRGGERIKNQMREDFSVVEHVIASSQELGGSEQRQSQPELFG